MYYIVKKLYTVLLLTKIVETTWSTCSSYLKQYKKKTIISVRTYNIVVTRWIFNYI